MKSFAIVTKYLINLALENDLSPDAGLQELTTTKANKWNKSGLLDKNLDLDWNDYVWWDNKL